MSAKLICVSHTPLMDFSSPPIEVEQRARQVLSELADEVSAYSPDLIILFGPDHFNGFFYDLMPPACIGIHATAAGDWDMGPGAISVPEREALCLIKTVLSEGVGTAYSYRMTADHGITQPLLFLTGSLTTYPVIPIFINGAAMPLMPMSYAVKLGRAVGKYLKTLVTHKKVLILGSGGLSHDPPTPQMGSVSPEMEEFLIAGRNPTPESRAIRQEKVKAVGVKMSIGEGHALPLNADWDQGLLQSFVQGDFERFEHMTDEEICRLGGKGGHEIRCWVAACAAMNEIQPYQAEIRYYEPIQEWIAGFGALTASHAPVTNDA
ncbi:3-carboxyethylcatechol 2,3-dioxygenase [Acinetobacter sp. MB5]|uniref:3-carboxyethylcatechol 2,3-dioxygenase n=1 Tax=Acinetobacter sp. MB5 TaxID=2069438 RepID=UPI000DCFAFA3|nr:3-carboxyethylcatechol 2,3-dioxygenase [Acinetobacter sp. MB5]